MRIELRDVRKVHLLPGGGFLTVLAGVDLNLESGRSAILRGESGSGKSTLLNIMGGLARPTSGTVLLDGTKLKMCGDRVWTIAHAFQEPVFIPELTVMENLLLPLIRRREDAVLSQGESLLERFGLTEAFDRFPADLSTGEKRRLNLARAILARPRLLLLDEPFAGLDKEWGERALALVVELVRDTGATLVIASTGQIPGSEGFRQLRLQKGKVITDGNSDC